ncbi:MAG: porin family protein [Cyclobacteriaceae bacterium]|nr:MAG: porin family protein [Cyclobacteriaceae bacterium]
MKKLLVVIALIMAVTASAQTIIPKAGMTLSTLDAETFASNPGDFDSYKNVTGFSVGVGYRIGFGDLISLQPELLFIQKGWKNEYGYDDGFGYTETYTETAKLNYIELPILLRIALGPDKFKFHINVGPSVGYGINGKYDYESKIDYYGDISTFSTDGDIKFEEMPENYEGPDEFIPNRIELGAQIGGGVTLFNKILVDVRYGLGLTDLSDDGKSKNRVLQFTVGVPIGLGL